MLTVGSVPGTVIVTLALPVAPSLVVTVKVKVTTWVAAVVAGAVQVASSTAALLNVPTLGVAVHRRVAPATSALRDVARRLTTVPPGTVWSIVSTIADRRAARDRDRDTSHDGGGVVVVGHSQGEGDRLGCRRCSRRRPGRVFCSRVMEPVHRIFGWCRSTSTK